MEPTTSAGQALIPARGVLSSSEDVSKFPLDAVLLLPIEISPPVEELQLELGTKTGDCTFILFFAVWF